MTVMAGDAAYLLRATLLIYSGRRCLFTQGDAAYLLRATLLIYSGRRLPPPKSQEAKTISISTTKSGITIPTEVENIASLNILYFRAVIYEFTMI